MRTKLLTVGSSFSDTAALRPSDHSLDIVTLLGSLAPAELDSLDFASAPPWYTFQVPRDLASTAYNGGTAALGQSLVTRVCVEGLTMCSPSFTGIVCENLPWAAGLSRQLAPLHHPTDRRPRCTSSVMPKGIHTVQIIVKHSQEELCRCGGQNQTNVTTVSFPPLH
ncbi:hypothetical protein NX059_008303 [Plenodomus lindquistii]|nr:hypothetical protein NX059_008303 [Plenodomus lindquistii]